MSIGLSARLRATSVWAPLDVAVARDLVDSRLQLHHAAQLATAAGISFLRAEPDDGHTNLEWLSGHSALASHVVSAARPFRIAVRATDLTLLILGEQDERIEELPLHGSTIANAAEWVRHQIANRGLDSTRYTLRRHYAIPAHLVESGEPFALTSRSSFEQLAGWFGNADLLLRELASHTEGAGTVRCWPHHFDIATLVKVSDANSPTRTIGVGLEPGDEYYAEPYLYVNLYPAPKDRKLPALAGGGRWHTNQWVGAVLPGSELTFDVRQQRTQMETFVASAMEACRRLLA